MGDVNGFIKYVRENPSYESPSARIEHFEEFEISLTTEKTKNQAARCMDCGIPFCHNGCPLGNLIPDFNDAVYDGDWKTAFDILDSTNNFPEFTGRICPAPCESSCVLGINNDAVAIEHIEKSIIETAFENNWVRADRPNYQSGKKVAIIGSGPAGLACADQLNKAGHSVTVFEKDGKAGGLLRYGIPDFKLGKNIVDRRIKLMIAQGVNFQVNIDVGQDISVDELKTNYDATVLCGGSSVPRDLPIPGRNLKGIHFAMEYLKQNNKRVAGELTSMEKELSVKGKHVFVIGGGDTGSDCIGTSNRLGAASVTQIEIMGKPPVERGVDNPWPEWPMVMRTSSSQAEGCEREWALLTKEFMSDDGENISGVHVVNVVWEKNELGQFSMKEKEGTSRIIPCDMVLLAVGFLRPPKHGLLSTLGVALDKRGNVQTDNYLTSVDNVFAAGDMRRGQSLVVWAISEGREAARAVDRSLRKEKSLLPSKKESVLFV